MVIINVPISFDEVHFGTFAGKYIQGTFFFDVHPPLAKMLVALVGWLAGYNGEFDFTTIGNVYDDTVPYVAMRAASALMGLLMVPMAYLTIRDGGHSVLAAILAALLVLFENSLITNNRLILLDSYLLFFTAFTIMSFNKFYKQTNKPFGALWWTWLSLTGIGLGLTVSCKWVGLFVIATVGCSTIKDLWRILGDSGISKGKCISHFLARSLCLIIVPFTIYVTTFYIHFKLLPLSGEGDLHMSNTFRQTLVGNAIDETPVDVAYGSHVTIRHLATNGGYLHSHNWTYPQGSKQQQVTLYPYHDQNNWWILRKANTTLEEEEVEGDVIGSDGKTPLEWIYDGDIVRLEHVSTSPRKLHSHDVHAPLVDNDYTKEVSAYGFPDYDGDSNDHWMVEIEDGPTEEAEERLQARQTRFRLVHVIQNCALFSHNVKLPDWGFGQQEVVCMQSAKKPKTLWMIESTTNDLCNLITSCLSIVPKPVEMVTYDLPGFWGKFVELHKVMWTTNAGLTGAHPYESRPSTWPMLKSGISFWAIPGAQVFYIGNPVVYWLSTVAVFTYVILWGFFRFLAKTNRPDRFPHRRPFFENAAGFYAAGWAFHYLVFYLMGRQLFLHHYLPALYFSILVLAVGLDLVFLRLGSLQRALVTVLLVSLVVHTYLDLSPLTYGTEWTREACEAARWLPSWEISCDGYPSQSPDILAQTMTEPVTKSTFSAAIDQD
ncbi:Dolichyl-phosphate-mannose-protein mannosyltransferase-domain-containing protein [Phycomyces nitens]|nr:Dolichyl-phosphate-mannose-protein mannosyltransferase-domain-containing protein [Phycomyces nitens]